MLRPTQTGDEPSMSRKSFDIPKWMVWRAWQHVKAKGGGPGVDRVSLAEYEIGLGRRLYKLWNRMASGSYFPSAVRRVDIPKADGTMRSLGIPTIEDRIAQQVVRQALEPKVEPLFHPDSYGYRPGKSALQAVGKARERCWRYNWVLDVDISRFFDTLNHELLKKAVRHHAAEEWINLYVGRWLTAAIAQPDGTMERRVQGTPQGGVISPLLANLYLHYALDRWMVQCQPDIPFERYADDVVFHCETRGEAERLKRALSQRLAQVGLSLNLAKTRIVLCRDSKRFFLQHDSVSFDFLGTPSSPVQPPANTGVSEPPTRPPLAPRRSNASSVCSATCV